MGKHGRTPHAAIECLNIVVCGSPGHLGGPAGILRDLDCGGHVATWVGGMTFPHKALASETAFTLDGPVTKMTLIDSTTDYGIDDCDTPEQAWALLYPGTPLPDLTWKREQ